jgi:chorismate mutase/prephenate dehydratase
VTYLPDDPVVSELRAEISILDRRLVATFNDRLRVVGRMHRHKLENGIPLTDPEREAQMLEHLTAFNGGPLSEAGLAAFYGHVLGLTKLEVAHE